MIKGWAGPGLSPPLLKISERQRKGWFSEAAQKGAHAQTLFLSLKISGATSKKSKMIRALKGHCPSTTPRLLLSANCSQHLASVTDCIKWAETFKTPNFYKQKQSRKPNLSLQTRDTFPQGERMLQQGQELQGMSLGRDGLTSEQELCLSGGFQNL